MSLVMTPLRKSFKYNNDDYMKTKEKMSFGRNLMNPYTRVVILGNMVTFKHPSFIHRESLKFEDNPFMQLPLRF